MGVILYFGPDIVRLSKVLSRANVPHVVLPVWFDAYDFATHAGWLGIGDWGNRYLAPNVDGGELGKALVRVVASDESKKMFYKSRKLLQSWGKGGLLLVRRLLNFWNCRYGRTHYLAFMDS